MVHQATVFIINNKPNKLKNRKGHFFRNKKKIADVEIGKSTKSSSRICVETYLVTSASGGAGPEKSWKCPAAGVGWWWGSQGAGGHCFAKCLMWVLFNFVDDMHVVERLFNVSKINMCKTK